MSRWTLDPRLDADTLPVIDLALSRVLLMRDRSYAWLVLVPRLADKVELIDLTPIDRHALLDEIALASEVLQAERACDKLNVAALGNMVAQLHVHVIARRRGDAAWPGPVWGKAPPVHYGEAEAAETVARLAAAFRARL